MGVAGWAFSAAVVTPRGYRGPIVDRSDLVRVCPEGLLARAADLISESASLVHDNERRWRVFHDRVHQVLAETPAGVTVNNAEPPIPTT